MFTSNFNDSNSLVEGFYLVLLAVMGIVAALSVLFALGSIACAALDCSAGIKQTARNCDSKFHQPKRLYQGDRLSFKENPDLLASPN